jgi:hypothetical protein
MESFVWFVFGVRGWGSRSRGSWERGWRETVVLTLHCQRDGLKGNMMFEGLVRGWSYIKWFDFTRLWISLCPPTSYFLWTVSCFNATKCDSCSASLLTWSHLLIAIQCFRWNNANVLQVWIRFCLSDLAIDCCPCDKVRHGNSRV